MISKRITPRKDGRSSALAALRYGEGLTPDRETGAYLDKSHRTRLGNFGLVDDGVYQNRSHGEMAALIEMAALEMQANADLNNRVTQSSQLAHFIFSFNQIEPSEAALRDTEDTALAALGLADNHFASFLHNDNGYWHLHIFASRIEKVPAHRCAELWQDRIKRDKVCRDIEQRHGLPVDNGLHQLDNKGQLIEVPREERRARREHKEQDTPLTDKARVSERYSGEKTFQTWCNEIRIGDRLKHAKTWKELHEAAAAYGCDVRQKGAGFVLCPINEKGGIQLSKVGLKNLPAKFGAFQSAPEQPAAKRTSTASATYEPTPTRPEGKHYYSEFKKAKAAFQPARQEKLNQLRTAHQERRAAVRAEFKTRCAALRKSNKLGPARTAALSITKMEQAAALSALAASQAAERTALLHQLAAQGPGRTFRDYLARQASAGDANALELAQRYGADAATSVLQTREADALKIVAGVAGQQNRIVPRLTIQHRIERSGTVVYDLGAGRKVTDSALARQIQLNAASATDRNAIEISLRLATAKFGQKLTLTGPADFQKLAVEVAVQQRLGVRFADPALEAYREKLMLAQKPASIAARLTHQQFLQGAERVLRLDPTYSNDLPDHPGHRSGTMPTGRSSVHELPVRVLDGDRPDAFVLLSADALLELDNLQAGHDSPLRRSSAGAGTGRTEKLNGGTGASEIHTSHVGSSAGERLGASSGSAPGRSGATHSNPAIRTGVGTDDSTAGRSPELGASRVGKRPGDSGEQTNANRVAVPPSAPITAQSAESRVAAPIAITENPTVPIPVLPTETVATEPTPAPFDGAAVLREQYPDAIDAVLGLSYSGKVLTINETHLIHRSGQGAPVIHRLEDLPRNFSPEDMLNVRYTTSGGKAIDLARTRDGGRDDL